MLIEKARAKVNLTLHVLGRRADGYHELDSLVAFAGTGDTVSLLPGKGLSLTVSGEGAAAAGPLADNLILKAADALAQRSPGVRLGTFHLVKRLPVAAGIGGGSADAAAALRLLARANRHAAGDAALIDAAMATGSDVRVCLASRGQMMRGAGEDVCPVPPFALYSVLVNPRVPVATPAVFAGLGLARGERHIAPVPFEQVSPSALAACRNDLQAPALAAAPIVGEVLAELEALPGARLARMSGSGATCFALFDDRTASTRAAAQLQRQRPGWWIKATVLR